MPTVGDLLAETASRWLADPESDVVHVEWVDDRLAVRMRQDTRDATTVWWDIGERSLRAEAYVLPAPPPDKADAYRLCLRRNHDAFRVWFAIDADGAVVIRARVPVGDVDARVLDQVLGEIYSQVESTFRPLLRAAFGRENSQ